MCFLELLPPRWINFKGLFDLDLPSNECLSALSCLRGKGQMEQ